MTTLPFTNFTKGEIAPELQARLDTTQYKAAARRVRNFIIQRYGGLSFRPGFRFVGEVDDVSWTTRYMPFQFNIEQAYVLAFGQSSFRLLSNGGFVIEDNLKITAITQAANGKITAAYHGFVVGDRIYFTGIVGMTELNGRYAKVVSVVDANNFTIDVDTTNFTAFVSSDGIVRTGAPAAPPAPAPTPSPTPKPTPPPTTDSGGNLDNGGNPDQVEYIGIEPINTYYP